VASVRRRHVLGLERALVAQVTARAVVLCFQPMGLRYLRLSDACATRVVSGEAGVTLLDRVEWMEEKNLCCEA
jgi:hypothetical protein